MKKIANFRPEPFSSKVLEDDNNPLAVSQREKAGSTTFSKYRYQYHWALFRILHDHSASSDAVIFVELHEDVVFASTQNKSDVKFEFNQVKTTKTPFSAKDLVRVKNGSSILGKLMKNINNPSFGAQIEKLQLVSAHGFKLKLADPDLELELILFENLDESTSKTIKDALSKELGITDLPENVTMLKPKMSEELFKEVVVDQITELIQKLHPESLTSPANIYRLLINELYQKGEITTDYTSWNEAVEKKGLTSGTVSSVIETFTNTKSAIEMSGFVDSFCKEMGLTTMESIAMRQGVDRYRQNKFLKKSPERTDFANELQELLKIHKDNCNGSIIQLIDLIKSNLSKEYKTLIIAKLDLDAAIIYEYLTM